MTDREGENGVNENLHPYGDHFKSYDELLIDIAKRRSEGKSLRGAAVVYLSVGEEVKRVPVRVMPDGELNFAHAEWF